MRTRRSCARRSARTRTVFANVFFGAGVGDAGAHGYLCCGSSSGAISVFNLDDVLRRSRDATRGESRRLRRDSPRLVIRAHVGAAYAVVAATRGASAPPARMAARSTAAVTGPSRRR